MEDLEIQKELAVIKTRITKTENQFSALEIKSEDDLVKAGDQLNIVLAASKALKAKKDEIVKPINEGLRRVRDLFRPYEDHSAVVEKTIRGALSNYKMEQDRIAKAEEEKIAARAEKGTLLPETAVKKMAEIKKVEKVEGKKGTISWRKVREVVFEDESQIPREYLVPDRVRIRKDALAGVQIAGIKVVERDEPVGRQ